MNKKKNKQMRRAGPAAQSPKSGGWFNWRNGAIAAVTGFLLLTGFWVFDDWNRTIPADSVAVYVGRDQCIQCHQEQADLFHGSDHDLAMDVANEQTVLGNFENQTLEHYGVTSKFYRDGSRFMVQTEGPDGKLADFEVKYVFGFEPLQQYMVELEAPANTPTAAGYSPAPSSNTTLAHTVPHEPVPHEPVSLQAVPESDDGQIRTSPVAANRGRHRTSAYDKLRSLWDTAGPAAQPGSKIASLTSGNANPNAGNSQSSNRVTAANQVTEVANGGSNRTPLGRVQVLRLSWDTQKQEWFYLDPPDVREKLDPDDPLHWTGITQNWNSSCAFCHSTDVHKNFDLASLRFRTTFSEIDVSCEACHGPGSHHVDLARGKTFFWDRKQGYGLVRLKSESNRPQIEACAPCHSRRREIAEGYVVGCNMQDYFEVSRLEESLYHCDGQIRDEVYVYGSYIQSKMYHQNIKCTDCHDPHSTRVKYQGNQLCTSCHQHPASKYDTREHHHHEPGSAGSLCVECHMPETTYMQIDARRDHSLRVPRPDLSQTTGAPNACTSCHIRNEVENASPEIKDQVSQYLDWIILRERGNEEATDVLQRVDQAMATAFEQWYPGDSKPTNYGPDFHSARNEIDQLAERMRPLINRSSVPTMIRATAAGELVRSTDAASLDAAFRAVSESDPEIVAAAIGRLESEISFQLGRLQIQSVSGGPVNKISAVFSRLAPLLSHPSRLVRIESARVAMSVPMDMRQQWLTEHQSADLNRAFEELVDSLLVMRERGEAHRALGSLYESVGDIAQAERHYELAIRLQPSLTGSRWNLALIIEQRAEQLGQQAQQLAVQRRRNEAESLIGQAAELAARAAQLRDEEHAAMVRDLERMESLGVPDSMHYQVGMSYYRRGEYDQTEIHLRRAYDIAPENERNVRALAAFYEFRQDWPRALQFARRLVRMPNSQPGDRQLLQGIEQAARQQ